MSLREELEQAIRAHALTTGERLRHWQGFSDMRERAQSGLNIWPLIEPRTRENRIVFDPPRGRMGL